MSSEIKKVIISGLEHAKLAEDFVADLLNKSIPYEEQAVQYIKEFETMEEMVKKEAGYIPGVVDEINKLEEIEENVVQDIQIAEMAEAAGIAGIQKLETAEDYLIKELEQTNVISRFYNYLWSFIY